MAVRKNIKLEWESTGFGAKSKNKNLVYDIFEDNKGGDDYRLELNVILPFGEIEEINLYTNGCRSLNDAKMFCQKHYNSLLEEMFEQDKSLSVIVLNITSWRGISVGATHYYAQLVFLYDESLTVDNVSEISLSCRDNEELYKELTLEEAKNLDFLEGDGDEYERWWKRGNKLSNRFDSEKECLVSAVTKIREYGFVEVPFVVLIENEFYPVRCKKMPHGVGKESL